MGRRHLALALSLVLAIVAGFLTAGAPPAGAVIPTRVSGGNAIPAGAPAVTAGSMVPVVIEVLDAGTITDVDVAVRLNHTFVADLDIFLRHPDGTLVELSTDNGSGGDNFGTGQNTCRGGLVVFDDEFGSSITGGTAPFPFSSYNPEGDLADLDGKPAAGTWQLEIVDDTPGDTGTMGCVELRLGLATGGAVTVTTTADVADSGDGLVSLREAFDISSNDGVPTTITLAPGAVYPLTCEQSDGVVHPDLGVLRLDGLDDTVIEGHGATITGACPGGQLIGAFGTTADLTVRDLTLTNATSTSQVGGSAFP